MLPQLVCLRGLYVASREAAFCVVFVLGATEIAGRLVCARSAVYIPAAGPVSVWHPFVRRTKAGVPRQCIVMCVQSSELAGAQVRM